MPFSADHLPADIEQAWSVRPELRYLDFQIEQVRVELTAAENLLQPRVDAQLEASKDVGARADPKGDKTPFVLEAGIYGEVPLQRRQASGKIQSLQGKLSQVLAKRQYAADKIAAEVQDAVSALEAAAGRIDRASTAVDLARQSLDLGRLGFESGDLTVITLESVRTSRIGCGTAADRSPGGFLESLGGLSGGPRHEHRPAPLTRGEAGDALSHLSVRVKGDSCDGLPVHRRRPFSTDWKSVVL